MNNKIKKCGYHNRYVDGSYRPKFRGWFHEICLILSFIIIPLQWHSMTIILKIPMIAICFTLLCSSICHLYPFRSIYWERLVTKLDRFSIILINVTSFSMPQLTVDRCRPALIYTILTVIIPNFIGSIFILKGINHPAIFFGLIISSIATSIFWLTYDIILFTVIRILFLRDLQKHQNNILKLLIYIYPLPAGRVCR